MIIFLCGFDSFRSRQKLNAMVDQFKKTRDPNGDNVVCINGDKTSVDEINSKISSGSLLAEKRLLIVENFFSHKEKNIFKSVLEYLKKMEKNNNDNSLIFYEGRELDNKKFGGKKMLADQKKLFDYLVKQKFSEKFDSFNYSQTANWIKKQAAGYNINIAPDAAVLLATSLDNDLWAVNNELKKVTNFVQAKKQNKITAAHIKEMVSGRIDDNIFALTDAISNKNRALFFTLLENQLEAGNSLQQILTILIRQFKIILQIKELLIQNSAAKDIAGRLKLHPFVVQKTTPQTRNFSIEYLKSTLAGLVKIDYKIKTGQADGLTSLNLLFSLAS